MNVTKFSIPELTEQINILARNINNRIDNPYDVLSYIQDMANVVNELHERVSDIITDEEE